MESARDVRSVEVESASSDGYLRTMGNLFVNPGRAFESLARVPRWFIPFLLCALAAVVFEVGSAKYRMADRKERIQHDTTLSQEEIQRRIGNIDAQRTTSISAKQLSFGVAVLTVAHGAKLFAMALVFWLALQLYSSRVRFPQILAVCSFIFLVTILERIMKMLLILAKGSYGVFLGPAVLLPQKWFGSPLFKILDRLDVFSLWMAVLLTIALVKVASLSRSKAVMTVGYLWVLWLLEGALLGN